MAMLHPLGLPSGNQTWQWTIHDKKDHVPIKSLNPPFWWIFHCYVYQRVHFRWQLKPKQIGTPTPKIRADLTTSGQKLHQAPASVGFFSEKMWCFHILRNRKDVVIVNQFFHSHYQ